MATTKKKAPVKKEPKELTKEQLDQMIADADQKVIVWTNYSNNLKDYASAKQAGTTPIGPVPPTPPGK